ncbi:MAG: hypothetical protein JWP85_2477 [Rhodoglobus sp.]|nr:hypothetical protein [Rhodoglobus sp.]
MITIISIVVVAVALILTAVASGRSRHWLVAPAAVVVLLAILLLALAPFPLADDRVASVVLAIGFGAIGVLGGSPVVALVLRFAQGNVELGDHGGIVVADPEAPAPRNAAAPRREILRGGATIGYLERAALIGAIAAGQASAVAVIVAIKGLGRFSELDDSEARERFIIGTLTSLIWAGACAAAAVLV